MSTEQIKARCPAPTALVEQLRQEPEDWPTYLVLADWEEERGEPLADTLRWMADNQRRPWKDPETWQAKWMWTEHGAFDAALYKSLLPPALYRHLKGNSSQFRSPGQPTQLYDLWFDAVRDLHRALGLLAAEKQGEAEQRGEAKVERWEILERPGVSIDPTRRDP